ncbi:uncharacterized protein LOC141665400 [Apium graveolens]|uniref:uncharacterized protein LOC141665400 n=1 Tax=Apium graveolens TaxID=4045 RepID=UPI003D7BE82E
MISGGPIVVGTTRNAQKAYAREVINIVREAPKHAKNEKTLEFGGLDLEGLKFPQDDPLVITTIIENCLVKRVLVDNGASVDILFHDMFLRMEYTDSQLSPSDGSIYRFNGVQCQVEEAIQLSVTIGEEPIEATQMLNFQVVKETSTYNSIMGRTGIHAFKDAPSTYHMARWNWGKVLPVEYMDVRENEELREKLAEDLNSDVFSWTVANVPGIDPDLITHKLNVDPNRKAAKQKKRTYTLDRLEAIKQIDIPIDASTGHEMLSFMDDFSVYNQIKIQKDDTRKVSFITEFGICCYLVMAFGLKNAGATYQRLMNKLFANLIGKTMEVYVDDMLVKSLAKADHINHIERYLK